MVITKQPQIGGEGIALAIRWLSLTMLAYSSRAQRFVSVQLALP